MTQYDKVTLDQCAAVALDHVLWPIAKKRFAILFNLNLEIQSYVALFLTCLSKLHPHVIQPNWSMELRFDVD